jgi:type II secretory pathway component PulF
MEESTASPAPAAAPPAAQTPAAPPARRVVAVRQPAAAAKPKAARAKKAFPKKDLIKFYRGMASMLRAQINTGDALKYYAHGLPNKDLAATLEAIQQHIVAGMTVHEAFRKSGRFDDMTVGLLHAGTDSGRLDEAFRALATRIKSDVYFRSKVRKAVVVPCIVISLLVFAFIMSQVRIVPQVEDMIESVRQQPDPFTKMMFKMSHITQAVWPAVVIAIIATVVVIWRSNKVRNVILNLVMAKWRLCRMLVMGLRQLTFLGTLHMLHSNGIQLAKAIRTAAESVRSTPLFDELVEASERYQNSALPISEAFRKFTSCDAQIGHMLSIGERTASIDTQLALLAQMYEEDTENYMEEFTTVLNFAVLIIAVFLIGAVFIGTFMPIFLMGPKMMQRI